MPLAYAHDDCFAEHRPPSAHPERPERYTEAVRALGEAGLSADGIRIKSRQATLDELARVHQASYLGELESRLPGKSGWLDGDTYFSPGTYEAVRRAAGAAIDATSVVLDGRAERAVAVVRPPGHHAEADRAMGFCLVNNIAVAAAAARAAGAARVSIVDWDVHHGNGTQHCFYSDPDVQFLSVHQYPFYPGTGAPTEVGTGAGAGKTINVGLPAGCRDGDYDNVFRRVMVPAIRRHRPDVVLVSAGFDAFHADPLAGMNLTASGFAGIAAQLVSVANEVADGRIVLCLEGGYDLEGLSSSLCAVVRVLAGEPAPELASQSQVSVSAERAIEATLSAHARLEAKS